MDLRRRYALIGPQSLRDSELLALAAGGGSVLVPSSESLLSAQGGLRGLTHANPLALCTLPGLGQNKALHLHAALHAGLRAFHPPHLDLPVVEGPEDAWLLLGPELLSRSTEELHSLYLNNRNQVLYRHQLTRGSPTHTLVDAKQVLRPAIACGATGVIVAHNHPSGDPEPSLEDIRATHCLSQAAQTIGIRLIDHLVVGHNNYTSMAREGLITH